MASVLLYAYCQGVRSSRRIAMALERDIESRAVAANGQPDFRNICRFRAEHEEALQKLFAQVLGMCREAGLVKLGAGTLDGTKVAANADLDANRSHQIIEVEVQRMLTEAKATDTEEDARYGPERRGDELPEGLGRRAERLKRLGEAKERLEREAEAAVKASQEHLLQRQGEEEATGKKKRGRKPKVVEPGPTEGAKANTTDPDSRVMKTRQGYVQQLEPMLQTLEHTLEAAGIEERPKVGLADAGYWGEANIKVCSGPQMPELLIATTKSLP